MIRARRVDTAKPATAALLQWLQLEVLPLDTPLATDEGVWWVAYVDDAPAHVRRVAHRIRDGLTNCSSFIAHLLTGKT